MTQSEEVKDTNNLAQQTPTEEVKPAESAAVEPKKTNSKKVILFVLLGIIIFACVVCGGAAGAFYYYTLQQTKGLKKTENDKLVFYYPENYNADTADSGQFVYTNPDKNKFGGNSSIRTMEKDSLTGSDKIKDLDTCKKFAEGTLESEDEVDPSAPKAENISYSEILGVKNCFFTMKYDAKDFGKEGNVEIKVKLILKSSDAAAVVASYDDSSKDEEKDRLNRSINLFAFK